MEEKQQFSRKKIKKMGTAGIEDKNTQTQTQERESQLA